ncbi:PREDICTED: UDP-GlcNAc:betaGal beta-1,3-N-acetylglucosaminyltransferase 8 [Nanorana parkeri]|uniref:UDP-GlcNAc:betaGal beta-1,3-N-acetylglucosaminyltransferase 8 n=1 Tax=Nanorana parkeri TaxID=125878 RepID=UPI000854EA6E|nr:PREDICTED: UDP-GlcNAc:betaGal beta-1,3-N-acetylglucosaminyltransferase 8 [Nanorana parkeri]
MLELHLDCPCKPPTMVRCRKFSISLFALFMLVALKIFVDLTYTPPHHSQEPSVSPEPYRNPVVQLELLQGDEELSMATLHNLAQKLRKAVIRSEAFWNTEQLQLLDLKGPMAWTCKNATSVPQVKEPDSYPDLLQSFLAHSRCRNHRMIINQPKKCSANNTFLLLAIKSSPQNFAQRQAVRDSWGGERNYGGKNVKLVFLLGTVLVPDLSPLLAYESSLSRDLLQWDFVDTFFNLTLKDQLFLGWANKHCAGAKYILKGDDDVFARIPNIVQVLSLLDNQRQNSLYMGHVVKAARPYRDTHSKYYIPPSFYAGFYPPYAGGGGYVFSGRLTPWLYLVSRFVAPFPIDDVYTGMCFMALGVHPVGHPGFKTFNTPREKTSCSEKHLLLVHRKSPQEMLKMWGQHNENVQQC